MLCYGNSRFCYISLNTIGGGVGRGGVALSRQLIWLASKYKLCLYGNSSNLSSVFSSLTRLLGVCPGHLQFRAQPDIWAEFICSICDSLPLAHSHLGFTFHFPAAVVVPKHCLVVLQARMTVSFLPVFCQNFGSPVWCRLGPALRFKIIF